VFVTHAANEASMTRALDRIRALDVIAEVPAVIRVEDL
jgi:hypothetical protein